MYSFTLQLDETQFSGGETVSGKILLDINYPVEIAGLEVSLKGIEETFITVEKEKVDYDSQSFLDDEVYRSHRYVVIERQTLLKTVELSEGNYVFEFSFHLPSSCLPSYEGRYAKVYYYIECRIKDSSGNISSQKNAFHVLAGKTSEGESKEKNIELPFIEKGVSKKSFRLHKRYRKQIATCRIDKSRFERGETIEGVIELKDDADKSVEALEIQFYTTERTYAGNYKRKTKNIRDKMKIPVSPIKTQPFCFHYTLPKNIVPTIQGNFFNVKCGIKLRLYFENGKYTEAKEKFVLLP